MFQASRLINSRIIFDVISTVSKYVFLPNTLAYIAVNSGQPSIFNLFKLANL